jgi:hypothetical protein
MASWAIQQVWAKIGFVFSNLATENTAQPRASPLAAAKKFVQQKGSIKYY